MKICDEFSSKIIDLLEDNLSRYDRERLSGHMKNCAICQKEYEKMKVLYGILNEDNVPVPGQKKFDLIKDNIRKQEIRLKRHKVPGLIKVLVPVFAVALLVVLYVFRPERTVEISVPTSVLLEDETIAMISLGGILNDQLIEDLSVIEEDLPFEIDEMLAEFSDEERLDFIEILHDELNKLQEDV